MKCDDFNKKHKNLIPKGNYETIAGYIISNLGRIPIVGENLFMEIGQVIIKKASDRYIDQVQILPKDNEKKLSILVFDLLFGYWLQRFQFYFLFLKLVNYFI